MSGLFFIVVPVVVLFAATFGVCLARLLRKSFFEKLFTLSFVGLELLILLFYYLFIEITDTYSCDQAGVVEQKIALMYVLTACIFIAVLSLYTRRIPRLWMITLLLIGRLSLVFGQMYYWVVIFPSY
jgi:small-conductance mechanosensitive channel